MFLFDKKLYFKLTLLKGQQSYNLPLALNQFTEVCTPSPYKQLPTEACPPSLYNQKFITCFSFLFKKARPKNVIFF